MNSHKTALRRKTMSRPVKWLHSNGMLTKTSLLDFGCGRGKDVEELRALGYSVQGYDPHYFPEKPKTLFRTVMMIYVIGVLGRERNRVLQEAWNMVREGGRLLIVARTDHEVARRAERIGWKKRRSGYITKAGTYLEGYSLLKLERLADRLSPVAWYSMAGRTRVGGNLLIVRKRRKP